MSELPVRWVKHLHYGEGIVRRTRFGGFELRVEFARSGRALWVRADEVAACASPTSGSEQPSERSSPDVPGPFASRQAIEALRVGIVPRNRVKEFTFGREDVVGELEGWLRDGTANTTLLVGDYGSGKTHMLEYMYWRSLQRGFAVARVEIDGEEAPFNRPKRVYNRLIQSFRYPVRGTGRTGPFRRFAAEVLANGGFSDHPYFSHLRGVSPEQDEWWDWIEGAESVLQPSGIPRNRVPSMVDFHNAGNVYCYLLSSLGWAARHILRLGGLLLLFDEAEALSGWQRSYQRQHGTAFVEGLVRTAGSAAGGLLTGPPEETGLPYSRAARDVPFNYSVPNGLKLLMAFTPVYDAVWLSGLPEVRRSDLRPLRQGVYRDILVQIVDLYERAYRSPVVRPELATDPALYNALISRATGVRRFVKASVEALDLLRHHPEKPLAEVLH